MSNNSEVRKVSVIRSTGNGQKMVFSTLSGDMEEHHFPGKSNSLCLLCFTIFREKVWWKIFVPEGFTSFSLPDWLAWMLFVLLGMFLEKIICCYFVWWLVLDYGFFYLMLSGYVSFTCHTNREALFYINAHACANTHAFHACIL